MITIKEALTKKEMKEFVLFSFELYQNIPYWIPPLIAEELETFDKSKNPALQTAEAHFYLAYKDNKIVGKIAAIINWEEVNQLKKRKVRFGWFDAIDDLEVTKALLDKVVLLGKKHQMDHMEGRRGRPCAHWLPRRNCSRRSCRGGRRRCDDQGSAGQTSPQDRDHHDRLRQDRGRL